MKIEVVGSRELSQALARDALAGRRAAVTVLGRICQRVVPLAQAIAPDDPKTGGRDLKRSIRASKPRTDRASGVVSAGVVAGGGTASHAPPQEAGEAAVGRGGAMITFRHPHGGRSPFLLSPFLKEAAKAPGELLAEVDREVRRAR